MPVTDNGYKISAPFSKQDARPMGASSGLGTDMSIEVERVRNPAYKGLRAATPPTSAHHQRKRRGTTTTVRDAFAATSETMGSIDGKNANGRSSKWSLFRSYSTQNKATSISSPITQNSETSNNTRVPIQISVPDLKRSTDGSAISFALEDPQPCPSEPKIPGRSWSSKLLSKTRSSLNLSQVVSISSKNASGPPPRPNRPAESLMRCRNSGQASSSVANFVSEEANSRLDSYGWQHIKPLPGRNPLTSGKAGVSRARESIVSESCYSLDSQDEESLHMLDASKGSRMRNDKHREAAKGVNKQGKTPMGPPTIRSRVSTAHTRSNKDVDLRLTAVTEVESEPDYDKPLPAPPCSFESKTGTSALARKKKSHPILLQSEYKPWWEEQGIKERDLCLESEETQHSSLAVQAPLTERTQPSSEDRSETGSTASPKKSMLLTEIPRSSIDEQERAEDRERQERYRKEMRGKRLGIQMLPKSLESENESRVRSEGGKRRWRFSVFENEVESRPSTANTSSHDSLGKLEMAKEPETAATDMSAAASTLTLPESEKIKMRPSPLKINTTKANQILMPRSTLSNSSNSNQVKHPSALPTPLRVHHPKEKSQAEVAATRKAVMRLSDGTPVRSPRLIRRNGEVLLPPKEDHSSVPRASSFSAASPVPSSPSLDTWSHDEASLGPEKQPDTPPTANIVHYEQKHSSKEGEIDDRSDILDFYLDQYSADVAPAVPEKSPRRNLTTTDTAASKDGHGMKEDRTNTYTASSNPFGDQSDDEAEDDERRQWEEEERHKRVAAILGRLRAKASSPVMET